MYTLHDMYTEVLLDHYKNPRNKRKLPGAELQCHANIPLCGDELTVFAHLDGETLAEVTFQGRGCSICLSSASMMTEAVTGASVDAAKAMVARFRSMMAGKVEPDEESLGNLVAFKEVLQYPIRIKCAVLAAPLGGRKTARYADSGAAGYGPNSPTYPCGTARGQSSRCRYTTPTLSGYRSCCRRRGAGSWSRARAAGTW